MSTDSFTCVLLRGRFVISLYLYGKQTLSLTSEAPGEQGENFSLTNIEKTVQVPGGVSRWLRGNCSGNEFNLTKVKKLGLRPFVASFWSFANRLKIVVFKKKIYLYLCIYMSFILYIFVCLFITLSFNGWTTFRCVCFILKPNVKWKMSG